MHPLGQGTGFAFSFPKWQSSHQQLCYLGRHNFLKIYTHRETHKTTCPLTITPRQFTQRHTPPPYTQTHYMNATQPQRHDHGSPCGKPIVSTHLWSPFDWEPRIWWCPWLKITRDVFQNTYLFCSIWVAPAGTEKRAQWASGHVVYCLSANL